MNRTENVTVKQVGYLTFLRCTAALLILFLMSGCWNRRELNELSVVLAMGIDYKDDQYMVTVQVVDPSQMSRNRAAERSPTHVYTEKAATIFEAMRKVTTQSSRKLYFSHLLLLLFNEDVARSGIKEPLDFLFRDHEVRPDFNIAVARGSSAKDIMSFVTPMEVLPAMDLYKSLRVSEKAWAPTAAVNAKTIMEDLTKKGIEPVLTGLTLEGDIEKGMLGENIKQPLVYANFKFKGIGVFRDDRLIGWLNESDSKSYSYITNHVSNTVSHIKCPRSNGEFNVEVKQAMVKAVPTMKAGKPFVNLNVFIEANVAEVQCELDLTDEATFLAMQTNASKQLKQIITNGIHHVQETYGVDIYGFGELFHRKYPNFWHHQVKDWDHIFSNLPVEVTMNYKLRKFGKIISPIANNPLKDKE
ncbi:Ger(x)C family spore germination protein [Paenibacillus sp. Root444D2]|uniref:Ger(x)C family spore germination protein n=1 Tax=Paenibacillus sp. Root444D2 TaxID=1736538 RepID=UPI0009E684BE|nr:Ger(x)C family spore germination protein [Paenibacillus sp. Root444D2]